MASCLGEAILVAKYPGITGESYKLNRALKGLLLYQDLSGYLMHTCPPLEYVNSVW